MYVTTAKIHSPVVRNNIGIIEICTPENASAYVGGTIKIINSKAIKERLLNSSILIGRFFPIFTSVVFRFLRNGIFILTSVANFLMGLA